MFLLLLSLLEGDPRPVVVAVHTAASAPCSGLQQEAIPPELVARLRQRAQVAVADHQAKASVVGSSSQITLWDAADGCATAAATRAVCCMLDGSEGGLVVAAVAAFDEASAAMHRAVTLATDSISKLVAPQSDGGANASNHPKAPPLVTGGQGPLLVHAWARWHTVPLRRWMRQCLAHACTGAPEDCTSLEAYGTMTGCHDGPSFAEMLPEGWRGNVCGCSVGLVSKWCTTLARPASAPPRTLTPAHRDPTGAATVPPASLSIEDRMRQLLALSAAFQVRCPQSEAVPQQQLMVAPAQTGNAATANVVAPRYGALPERPECPLEDSIVVTDASSISGNEASATKPLQPAPLLSVAASTDWFFASPEPCADEASCSPPTLPTDKDSSLPPAQASSTPHSPSALPSHPAIAVHVTEEIALSSVCASSTTKRIAHRLLGNVFVDVDGDPRNASRIAASTPRAANDSGGEALPAIGYWRLEATAPSPSNAVEAVIAVDVRLEANWSVPRGCLGKTERPPPLSTMRPSVEASSTSSSSEDERRDHTHEQIWCPGRWTWCFPGTHPHEDTSPPRSSNVSDTDSDSVRTITVFLVCSGHYASTREPLLVATYDFTVDNALERRMHSLLSRQPRLSTNLLRPVAIRDLVHRVVEAWVPVNCKGRWLTEIRAVSGRTQSEADDCDDALIEGSSERGEAAALLFKGIVSVASAFPFETVACYFHPRVVARPDGEPTIHALGRPTFDLLKCKRHSASRSSSVGTCGWRNVLVHCSNVHTASDVGDGPSSSPAAQVQLAARFVYVDAETIAIIREKPSALEDVHGTLHVKFRSAMPGGSLSGMSLRGTTETNGSGTHAPSGSDDSVVVSYTLSSGEYLFGFA